MLNIIHTSPEERITIGNAEFVLQKASAMQREIKIYRKWKDSKNPANGISAQFYAKCSNNFLAVFEQRIVQNEGFKFEYSNINIRTFKHYSIHNENEIKLNVRIYRVHFLKIKFKIKF